MYWKNTIKITGSDYDGWTKCQDAQRPWGRMNEERTVYSAFYTAVYTVQFTQPSILYCCLYSENIEAAKGGGLGRQSLRVTMDNGASLNSTSLALGSSLGFIKPGHKMWSDAIRCQECFGNWVISTISTLYRHSSTPKSRSLQIAALEASLLSRGLPIVHLLKRHQCNYSTGRVDESPLIISFSHFHFFFFFFPAYTIFSGRPLICSLGIHASVHLPIAGVSVSVLSEALGSGGMEAIMTSVETLLIRPEWLELFSLEKKKKIEWLRWT